MGVQGSNGISWADATWNPAVGCDKVSPGCDHCWAEKEARIHYHREFPYGWNGTVMTFPERLEWPIWKRKPLRIAVGLMGDLFHWQVTDEFIAETIAYMWTAGPGSWTKDKPFSYKGHTFMLLTKRPKRMQMLFSSDKFWELVIEMGGLDMRKVMPVPFIWVGVSCENQETANERIPLLLKTPAALRFVSCEPLLGPIDLSRWMCSELHDPALDCREHDGDHALDWVIVGAESGPGARPCHPDWMRGIRDQCIATGVPFHFKQWGEWIPGGQHWGQDPKLTDAQIKNRTHRWDANLCSYRVGKKAAGHLLDGREWLEFPGGFHAL